MAHKTPLTLTAKNIPGNLQSVDTLRLVPRSGPFAGIGSAATYPNDLYISTDSQETYWSNGASWVKVGAGILNYVSSITGEATVVTIGGTSAIPTVSLTNDGVTNAKLANVATQTFKGRTTAATGDPEDLTVVQAKTMLNLSGTNTGDQTVTLTGDVTGSGTGSFAATVAANAITNAKLATMATKTVKGNSTGGSAVPTDLTTANLAAMFGTPTGSKFLADDGTLKTAGGTPTDDISFLGSQVSGGAAWTTRTSAADNNWRSACYGNGLFVAVGDSGAGNRVMTSPDGITWTIRTSAADNTWQSVCYGNGLFVAVARSGAGNRVMTSPDGITWTTRTSAADNEWVYVCYGNGLFVAVGTTGAGNRVMTSPDGITWTTRTSAADNSWDSVCYGNGLFVAVSFDGSGNRVMTSPDGITWTTRTSAANNSWNSVCYGNGLFVAVSYDGSGNRVMTSPNGTTWTLRTSAADNQWFSVCYGNGLFAAVAGSGTGNRVMTSPDGITWTLRTSAADNQWFFVYYSGGTFVALSLSGAGSRVMTSGKKISHETDFGGDLVSPHLGRGLKIKEGSNAKMGTAVLVAGALTVSTTAVTATSRIFLTSQSDGGTVGFQRVSARTAGTSFTITSSNPLDTSTIAWFIVEPSP